MSNESKDTRVDLGDFSPILAHLWRGGAFGHFWTLDTSSSDWIEVNGAVPGYPERWTEQNVYFGVNPCSSIPTTTTKGKPAEPFAVRSQIPYIAVVNALFAEFDAKDMVTESEYRPYFNLKEFEAAKGRKKGKLKDDARKTAMLQDMEKYKARCWEKIEDAKLPPTSIVDSGGGYQCYWFLKGPVPLTEDNRWEIASLFGAWVDLVGGDSGAKDLARVLRVPGSRNHKPEYKGLGYPEVKIVEYHPDRLYTLEDFYAHTGAVEVVKPTEPIEFTPGNLPVVDIKRLPKRLQDNLMIIGDDRSEHNWGVVKDLIRADLTNDEILALFYDYPIGYEGKFAERGESYLAETIRKAREKLKEEGFNEDGWTVYSLRDAYAERPPIRYVVDGLIALPSLNIFYGPPGSLKSLLTQDMLACIVAGCPWLEAPQQRLTIEKPSEGNTFTTQKAAVLWVDMDNGKQRTHEHIEAVAKARDLPLDAPFYYTSMPDPWPDLSETTGRLALAKQIKRFGAKVVVLDTLSSITGKVNLNDSMMAVVMANLRRLAEDNDCAIIVIHHQRKSNGNDSARKGESLLGHTSIEASLDLALIIDRKENDPTLTATASKVRGYIQATSFGAVFSFQHRPGTKDLAKASFSPYVSMTPQQRRIETIEEGVMKALEDRKMKKMDLGKKVIDDWTGDGKRPTGAEVSKVINLMTEARKLHKEVLPQKGAPEVYSICFEEE